MSPPGGGRGGFNKGPQLPWLLQQQIGGGSSSGARGGRGGGGSAGRGHSRGGSSASRDRGSAGFSRGGKTPGRGSGRPSSRKQLRKTARQEKRHHRFEVQQQQAQQRHTQQRQQQQQARQQHVGAKRPLRQQADAAGAPAGQPQKRQKLDQQQQPKPARFQQQQRLQDKKPVSGSRASAAAAAGAHSSSKTKFYEMLEADGVTAAAAAAASGAASKQAFLADLQLQRDMARKLKVKKGKSLSGPEDGLDALLSGITAGSSHLPAGIDPAAAAAAAAAAGDSGDALGSDVEDSELMSSDDGDDAGDDSESEGDLGFAGFMDGDSAEGEEGEDEEAGPQGFSEASDEGFSEEGADQGVISDEEVGLPGFSDGDSSSEEADEGESEDEEGTSEDEDEAAASGRKRRSSSSSSSSEAEDEEAEDKQPAAAAAAAGPKAAALAPDAAAPGAAKYVPPALRKAQAAAAAVAMGGGSGAAAGGGADGLSAAVQRRITGLLNRLAESNLQAMCRDILTLYEAEGRRLVADAVSAGLLAAVAEGPRATEQFAAVAAVFVGGLAAGARAQDVSARFLEMLVARLQQAYAADDGLACHNLVMLLAYCYSAGIVAADCMYSVLGELTRRFAESDVAMMLTLLNAVGLQLRSADPAAMKDFVLAVHKRAAAAGPGGLTKRAEIMLELVVDIKNNRARDVKASRSAAAAAAAGGGGKGKTAAAQNVGGGRGGAAAVLQPGLLKWLKASGVDDVTLANISWAKLVQPNKKGMWWHPAATDAADGLLPGLLAEHMHSSSAAAAAAAAAADGDDEYNGAAGAAGAGAGASAAQLLQLAAGMRMTTDARRAAFVAIMGSEDCAEACEKLLRLPLKGDQSREVVRVLVECCLQESRYNPYYGHLAARLAAVSKGHKVTLQYCIWDQWKEVAATAPRRLLCLAGLVGHLLGSFVLPLSIVKPIDFDACATWTSKETFLWRHTLQQLLTCFASDADAESAFSKLAQQQPLGGLCRALGLFLKLRVGPWLVAQADAGLLKQQTLDSCLLRLACAEKLLLSSTAAVLAG